MQAISLTFPPLCLGVAIGAGGKARKTPRIIAFFLVKDVILRAHT